MSARLTGEIRGILKELVEKLSGFEEGSEEFGSCEAFAHSHVDSYHYFFNDDRKSVEKRIDGLVEKFRFHGFTNQAEDLGRCCGRFLDGAVDDEGSKVRLGLVQFLLELSESPTTYFSEHPDEFAARFKDRDEVDWPSILNNTRINVKESYRESTTDEEWSITDEDVTIEQEVKIVNTSREETVTEERLSEFDPKTVATLSCFEALNEMKSTVQCGWWNEKTVTVRPESSMATAELALRWDDFVEHISKGLLSQKTNVIPEYRIMREVIWEFFVQHACFSYGIENNETVANENVSIASVRPEPFKNFLASFVPYFGMLKTFREFQNSILGEYFTPSIPDTYRSYNCALQEILQPIFEKITQIEDTIRKQECVYTLLALARDLKPLFQKVEVLHQIHEDLMVEFSEVDDSFTKVTYLLSRLYYALLNSASKVEQNIYLTLYLQSLYKYFTIIEIWLTQDLLEDYSDEFVIVDVSKSSLFDPAKTKSEFSVRPFEEFSKSDGMLAIITTTVLQLGKNIHLLRQLGKLHLVINEQGENYETLHDEYCRIVLEEIRKYLKPADGTPGEGTESAGVAESKEFDAKSVVICPETPRSKSGMDDLTNFMDVSDGFLKNVFEKYMQQNDPVRVRKETLYNKIENTIDRIVPVWHILEIAFKNVLKKRYSVPGLMVKNLLISQYNLDKYFSLVRRLYLFEEDIVFPFYKKMFSQFASHQPWGNFFWLTSKIHDLLTDPYPELYEQCWVDVSPNWRLCSNPLDAWDLVSIHLRIPWPINLIIQPMHMRKYIELFQFILKIKWALFTLNSLNFNDIEPQTGKDYKEFKEYTPLMQQRIRRLQLMRFRLINDVSSVHHYVLGHLYSTVRKVFDKSFEQAYDLESIVAAHGRFVQSMHIFCKNLRDNDSDSFGFAKVLSLVMHLNEMWSDIGNLSDDLLRQCEMDYLGCNKYLRPIIEVDVLF